MTKDYLSLAREYKNLALYRDLEATQICVMCKSGEVLTVFFPCQHKCVCDGCISKKNIGTNLEGSWNFCAICCEQIKVAFPHEVGSREVTRYWDWVNEVKPFVPPKFIAAFHKRSTKQIRLVAKEGTEIPGEVVKTKVCTIS